MIEVSSDIEIACSPDEAFAVIADMTRNPEWQKGMQSCEWTSSPPLGIGATYDQAASFLGRKILTSFEVTEFEAPRLIRIESRVSTFPLDITRTVVPQGPTTRVIAVVKGSPGGLAKVFAPLMTRMVRRSVRADYVRLKNLLES